ncbi:MAG: hypothetical protein COA52_13745, partial [Hyphomicrobiales bacterium]
TPERMGTVTVTLNISKDTGITGVLQVEKPETLALLQKDMAQLEKTLKAQGLDAKAGSFTVVLKASGAASKAVDGLANLANGGAAETASGFDAQAKAAGQNSSGQNSPGQNSNNLAAGSQQANAGQPTNAAQSFDKSLGNAALSGDEQSFQQSSQDRSQERSQGQSEHMHSSPEHGQQNHDADAEAEPLERNDNEVPEIILSAYAARNMQVNMSARLDLSI